LTGVRAGVRVGGNGRGGGKGPPIHKALALVGEDTRRRAGGRADEGGNNHLWVAGGRGVHGGNVHGRGRKARAIDGVGSGVQGQLGAGRRDVLFVRRGNILGIA